MDIDPHKRAAAARTLLDAVAALDLADAGTEDGDRRSLLALEPLGLDLTSDADLAATLAAAVELLTFFLLREAHSAGVSLEEVVSNSRQYVLPLIYPDVLGGPPQ
ncbi:hypothetical protein [Nocardioides sp. KR10-350]|uniref:hypothetical protein n=1 Tax=Nocardioides cheoyonin TaxID=3156615 RepID=UPI0032B62285